MTDPQDQPRLTDDPNIGRVLLTEDQLRIALLEQTKDLAARVKTADSTRSSRVVTTNSSGMTIASARPIVSTGSPWVFSSNHTCARQYAGVNGTSGWPHLSTSPPPRGRRRRPTLPIGSRRGASIITGAAGAGR